VSLHWLWAGPMILAAGTGVALLAYEVVDNWSAIVMAARIALLVFIDLAGEA